MSNKDIDINLTKQILSNINNGLYDNVKPVKVKSIPVINGNSIIDRAGLTHISFNFNDVCDNLRKINPDLREYMFGTVYGTLSECDGTKLLHLSKDDLKQIGVQLYPYVSYGILNGGSATSYADEKKNKALNPELHKLYKSLFEKSSKATTGKPKGIVPAFINADGSNGPSFIELKLRALLIENYKYRITVNSENEIFSGDSASKKDSALFPLFQMTSVHTDTQISEAIEKYKNSPFLTDLLEKTGIDITKTISAIQPMIAAFTHSSVGKPKQIFTNAFGRDGEMLPLPGGHGQNFMVLKKVYQYLYNELDKKLIYITNVDNIGNMPDPVSIAITAMSNTEASFEFSFRTPVDVKGGILVKDSNDKINCADIGAAIPREEVDKHEKEGRHILYNCATGLFKLDYLTENIETIIKELPMRITDQNKDSGIYSQAEQVTWEVIGLLKNPLILGVEKYERYLAAKLLLESFMTSGLLIEHSEFPEHENPEHDFKTTAQKLYAGLKKNLNEIYGMKEENNKWQPLNIDDLKKEIIKNY
ncbi:MAG: UTP--glucose-1-phosphate uridylyltransferase [Spirochaetales bacterium]|nr:UTP--glucose-1-phosphate uridylyltransferase [Spirochaetales bacterium]